MNETKRLYVTGDSIEDINSLENDSIKPFKWFLANQMKANKDKCHLLVSGIENIHITNVEGNIIEKSNCEKLLSVNVDNKLKFIEHLQTFKKAAEKANVLSRIFP